MMAIKLMPFMEILDKVKEIELLEDLEMVIVGF
jgi:hypothetical protein